MMKQMGRWSVLVVMAVVLISCEPTRSNKPDEPGTPGDRVEKPGPGDQINEPGPTGPPDHSAADRKEAAKLTLLYSTAISGEVWDCGCPGHPRGGAAQRCGWVKGLRDTGAPLVYLDGGNTFFKIGPPGAAVTEPEIKQARVLAQAMVRMPTDVVNVGDQDLRAGLALLRDDLAKAGGQGQVPLVSANLAGKDGQLLFPASRTVAAGDLKVSVFGLIGPDPAAGDSVTVLDPAEAARKMVAELRPGCDLLIGLFGLSFSDASRLAKEVPGIDIIVVSDRTSSVKTHPLVVGESLIVQAGNRGMYVGRMELEFKAAGGAEISREDFAKTKAELTRLDAQLMVLEGTALQDPAMKAEYDKVVAAQEELRKKLARSGDFNYDHTLISIEPDMAQDEAVVEWLKQAGINPPPAKGH